MAIAFKSSLPPCLSACVPVALHNRDWHTIRLLGETVRATYVLYINQKVVVQMQIYAMWLADVDIAYSCLLCARLPQGGSCFAVAAGWWMMVGGQADVWQLNICYKGLN